MISWIAYINYIICTHRHFMLPTKELEDLKEDHLIEGQWVMEVIDGLAGE